MPDTYSLPNFTKPELDALVQLIDLGVKAAGLQVAANAAHLHAKLNQAALVPKVVTPAEPTGLDNP